MAYNNVTVFGGSGFVGKRLVTKLLKQGWRVKCAVRHPLQAEDVAPVGVTGQYVVVSADITNPDSVKEAVSGSTVVINLVGKLFESGSQGFDKVHHIGAQNIATACAESGASQLIHISALGASEKSESLYLQTKAKGEQAITKIFPRATILRPSVIYGPGDGFFCRFEKMSRISPFLPLIGGGHTLFQPIYIEDMVNAIVAPMQDGSLSGQIFSIGGDQVLSFKSAMERMLKCMGRNRILLPLPWNAADFIAFFAGIMPSPFLTLDQVRSLRSDNIIDKVAIQKRQTIEGMGLQVTPMEFALPITLNINS